MSLLAMVRDRGRGRWADGVVRRRQSPVRPGPGLAPGLEIRLGLKLRLASLILPIGLYCCAESRARAQAADQLSPAETLLFNSNHWQTLQGPQTLLYAFAKSGSVEPGFVDQVRVQVSQLAADHTATVAVQFLSDARQYRMPTLAQTAGNPVLLAFLERDVSEMARLTGGKAPYFRRRIRLALADAAQLKPVTVSYQGRQLRAQEISSQPYLNDPMHARFELYTGKTYVFVLSPELAGGVYQIRTRTAGAGQPLMEETLTLVGTERTEHADQGGGQ